MAAPDASIDCTGLVVAPGFIDSHSHSDLQVLEPRPEKILQGVTTEVVGNCGFSPYPAPPDPRPLREFANGIFCGDETWGWKSAAGYLAEVERRATLTGAVSLVGHGTLRIFQAGHRLGALSERDLQTMEGALDEALAQGAAGLSTGLMYSPGESAPFEELERLCRVVARRGKIYTSHIRDYAARLPEAVEEQLELARRTGCRLQISHLQAVGPGNWPKQAAAIEKIEEARAGGLDVAFDCYPYVAGSTVLTQLLPQWVLEGGNTGMVARLSDPEQRRAIARETVRGIAQRWSDLYISAASTPAGKRLVGRHLEEIAAERGCEPVDALIDILIEESGNVNVLEFNQSQDNLRQLLAHPLGAVISDGFYVKGRPHPRLHGTFPFLLGEICRNRNWLSLPEAIRKITSWPAQRFGMKDRGCLRPGCFADVVVFDPAGVGSAASYENPQVPPSGIQAVYRGGHRLVNRGNIQAA
ncbi:MAG: amidohydrolase family protein [Bryobacteraceae bacterium]